MTQELARSNQSAPAAQQLSIKQMVESPAMVQRITKVAHSAIKPDKLAQALLFAVNRTPDLQRCSVESLFNCLTIAAQYGWTIGGPRPGMYMVPFGGVATPIPSYFGLQQTARESLDEWEIEADVVHEGDEFSYRKGLIPELSHRPHDDDSEVTHAYAIARSKSGRVKFDVMPTTAVEAIRARSRAGKSGPWVTDWEEMAKKTVVRRLCKYLPSSPALDSALELGDTAERPADLQIASASPVVNKSYARARDLTADVSTDSGTGAAPTTPIQGGGDPAPQPTSQGATDSPGAPTKGEAASSIAAAPKSGVCGNKRCKAALAADGSCPNCRVIDPPANDAESVTKRDLALHFSEETPISELVNFLHENEPRWARAKVVSKLTGPVSEMLEKDQRKIAFFVRLAILESK